MRRIVITGTALVVLVAASAAYSAGSFNTYTGNYSFSPSKAGSSKAPSPLGFVQSFHIRAQTAGDRPAPLIDVKTWLYGVVTNGKHFPTCSASKIDATSATKPLPNDNVCNPKALVASGPVQSEVGVSDLTQPASIPQCRPFLRVWNGPNSTLVFFLTTDPAHGYTCGPLHTGQTNAYVATVKEQGGYLVTDTPEPPDISTTVANVPNFYGSTLSEVLTFKNLKTKVHGKTVGLNQSVACRHGKRPWKQQFTVYYKGQHQVSTVSGSAKC